MISIYDGNGGALERHIWTELANGDLRYAIEFADSRVNDGTMTRIYTDVPR